jgi:methyl-accepting chemotaxis protein
MGLPTKIMVLVGILFVALSGIAVLGLQVLKQSSELDNIARINQLMKSTVNIVQQFVCQTKHMKSLNKFKC